MPEIKSYLFVGGSKDGEWYNIPKGKREYVFPKLQIQSLDYYKQIEEIPPYESIEHEVYKPVRLCSTYPFSNPHLEPVTIFVEESILRNPFYVWDIMCKLVNNYKVVK